MEHKTCDFCGTEYDASQDKCPLCGRVNTAAGAAEAEPAKKKRRLASTTGGARAEQKSGKGWKIASIILGIFVLLGIAGFVLVMDFTNERFDPNGIPTLMDGQKPTMPPEEVVPDAETEQEVPAEPAEPAVPEEPEEPEVPAEPGACTGLTISQNEVTMEALEDKVFLTAVARPTDCTDSITYESTDATVVTVTENGMLTAMGPGEAEIRVTCGTVTEICKVTCNFEVEEEPEEEPEPKPEENPDKKPEEEEKPEEDNPLGDPVFASKNLEDFTCRTAGETVQLSFHNVPVGITITYASSDEKVATVSADGVVKAVGKGTATITSTVGSTKLESIVRCDFETGTSTGKYTAPFKLSHEDVTLFELGESFSIALLDATGKKVENVGWFASNGCVTISGNKIKAAASGQCKVTVVFQDVAYDCIVRCNF